MSKIYFIIILFSGISCLTPKKTQPIVNSKNSQEDKNRSPRTIEGKKKTREIPKPEKKPERTKKTKKTEKTESFERPKDKQDHNKNKDIFDDRGFKVDGMHKNGTAYDDEGYNIEGFNRQKMNRLRYYESSLKLFFNKKSTQEIEEEKTSFFQIPFTKQGTRWGLNNSRSLLGSKPNAPLFHSYHGGALVPFHIKFLEVFRDNIPESIKKEIYKYDINDLGLFFVTQERGNSSELLLRAHHWVDPNMPNHFTGSRFNSSLFMGLFEWSESIEKDVKDNQLNSFNVSIHDSRLSPKNAKIDMKQNQRYFGWTLIIDQEEKKAAITLHWVFLDLDEAVSFNNLISNGETLESLIMKLESDIRFSDLLPSLENLMK